ncbi:MULTISPECIES: hypothetical protein [unclassified Pseudomonas]|uniref:hypothetical protein n=1 Tax=unclassified Pseudomonas TaxID=196821 RepID=UPI001482159C|nr:MULTISPECIES: hypothetical protein [unclassified Pseudomonas]
MKKSSSLAEQVLKAQRAVDGWPESIKSSMRLEGADNFLKTFSKDSKLTDLQEVKKKK